MRFCILIFIFMSLYGFAWGESWAPEDDKKLHMIAGAMISFYDPIAHRAGADRSPRAFGTIGLSMAIAAAKEKGDTVWSWADFSYTVAGTAVGVLGWEYLILPIDNGVQISFKW